MGADATASFALELDGGPAAGAAKNAAGALEDLRGKISGGIEELRAMQQAMRNLQGGSAVSVESFRKLKDQITAQKASIAAAQEKYLSLGGTMRSLANGGKAGAGSLHGLVDAARAGNGAFGGLLSKMGGLAQMLGKTGWVGLAILAAVAVVGLTAAIGAYGLAQANAARSERLALEGLTKIPNWYGLAADSASYLQDAINSVSATSALGRDKIAGYATELYKTGLRGQNLKDALDATAIASSAAGESYGSMVKGMLAGTAYVGGSVKKTADAIRARFGGVAKAQLLDLNVQTAKLKESFGRLFTGLKIEGFLSALNEVTQLFSQNTATGRALKVIIETLFNPIIAGAQMAAPLMKRFFQGLVIAALYVAIVLLTVRNKIRDTFGTPGLFKGIDWLTVALNAGIAVGLLFAAVGVAIAVPWIALGAVLAAVGWAVFQAGKLIWGTLVVLGTMAVMVGKGIGEIFSNIKAYFSGIDWGQFGTYIVDGFVNGITGGIGRVVSAVKNMGGSALKALASVLDSHSPSRKGFRLGFSLPEGMVGGVEKGTPNVENAVQSMVSIPTKAAGGDVQTSGQGPRGPGIEIHELHYHSSKPENHQRDAEDFKSKLLQLLEGGGHHEGAPA